MILTVLAMISGDIAVELSKQLLENTFFAFSPQIQWSMHTINKPFQSNKHKLPIIGSLSVSTTTPMCWPDMKGSCHSRTGCGGEKCNTKHWGLPQVMWHIISERPESEACKEWQLQVLKCPLLWGQNWVAAKLSHVAQNTHFICCKAYHNNNSWTVPLGFLVQANTSNGMLSFASNTKRWDILEWRPCSSQWSYSSWCKCHISAALFMWH